MRTAQADRGQLASVLRRRNGQEGRLHPEWAISETRAHWVTPQGTAIPATREITTTALLVGPAATMLAIHHMEGTAWMPPAGIRPAAIVALVIWSPLFFSVPALLLQDLRDAALPWRGPLRSLWRGFVLLPFLCLSKISPARAEASASLLGFMGAVVLALALHLGI